MSTTHRRPDHRRLLEQLISTDGHQIENALANQAQHMREAAAECERSSQALAAHPEAAAELDASNSMMTTRGIAHMRTAFHQAAEQADAALARWRELTGQLEEDEL